MIEYIPNINKPNEWYIFGHLAVYDPEDNNSDSMLFTEDMFHIRPVKGSWTLDVGWYPDGCTAEGSYRGILFEDDRPNAPKEHIVTRDPLTIVWWVEATLNRHVAAWE